jgi:hypothetical protein
VPVLQSRQPQEVRCIEGRCASYEEFAVHGTTMLESTRSISHADDVYNMAFVLRNRGVLA